MHVKYRKVNSTVYETCLSRGYPEVVARIIAGRTEVFDKNIFEFSLDAIRPAAEMADCTRAARRVASAIRNEEKILLFTDYDADGCTSMAVLYTSLHEVFRVPESKLMRVTGHRTEDGYGLTASVAEKIADLKPDLVITADAGASDGERIEMLASLGIDVIVTDHHLIPKEGAPEAAFAFVNPQRDNCSYDPGIAGCGVAWLLITAISKEMGCNLEDKKKIHQLLGHVALGTIADLAPLTSVTNRYFVKKGLEFINGGTRACWQVALNGRLADTEFLGFQIGPRINASSRMTGEALTALDFLIPNDPAMSEDAYGRLDSFNRERQKIERKMMTSARESINLTDPVHIYYSEENHPGIQGIVAGKLTDNTGLPVIMLADTGRGELAGSGRAGQFLHLRDALQRFDDLHPGVLIAFGGHRAAAGFKIARENFELFRRSLSDIVRDQLAEVDTTPYIQTDGSLNGNINYETCRAIEALYPFGTAFPPPLFHDRMRVSDVRVMGKRPVHISMLLNGTRAAFFNAMQKPGDPPPVSSGDIADVLYTLNINQWQGREYLQLIVKDIEPI